MGGCCSSLDDPSQSTESINQARKSRFVTLEDRIREEFMNADKNGDNALSFKEIKSMLHKLNFNFPPKLLKQEFEKFDEDGNKELSLEEFSKLFQALSSLPDVSDVFKSAAQGEVMTADELRRFLASNGVDEGCSTSDCVELILKTEMGEVPEEKKALLEEEGDICLTERGFAQILADGNQNSIIDGDKVNHVYQDMTKPLSHYFISSSHNTYLEGNQTNSASTVNAFKRAVLCGVRVLELDAWDGPKGLPLITHGWTLCTKVPFLDCIEGIKEVAFKTSEYPLILTIENHCSHDQQKEQARMLKETFGDMLFQWEGRMDSEGKADYKKFPEMWMSPEELKGKVVIRAKPKMKKPKEEKKEKGSKKGKEVTVEVRDDLSDEDTTEEVSELNKLLYIRNFKLKKEAGLEISPNGEGIVYPANIDGVTSSSFDENKMEKLVKPGASARDTTVYTQKHLLRIYPGGTRVNSSNYNPIPAWNAGCQVVALNYQTDTLPKWLNQGKFRENGGCGFVLKPEILMNKETTWNADPSTMKPRKLKVNIVCGHYLPKPKGKSEKSEIIDPYVKVSLHGLRTQEFSTKVIQDNGYNPEWKETFEFDVYNPDLELLSFVVKDQDLVGSDIIGQNVVPISAMRTGHRVVPINDISGKPIKHAHLFVIVNWQD